MKKAILFSLLFFNSWHILAQVPCNYQTLMNDGIAAAHKENYELALNKFNSARRCDPTKGAVIDTEINKVFAAINQQKVKAEKDEQKANAALRQVEIEKKAAIAAKDTAEKAKNETKDALEKVQKEKKKSDNRAILMRFISQANKIAAKECKKASKECNIHTFDEMERVWQEAEDSLPLFTEVLQEKITFLLQYYEIPSRSNIKKNILKALESTFAKAIKQTSGNEQIDFYKKRAIFLDKLDRFEESDNDWILVYQDSSVQLKGKFHVERSQMYSYFCNNKLATKHINKAIELIPNYAEAYFEKSNIDTAQKLLYIDKAISLANNTEEKAIYYGVQGHYFKLKKLYSLGVESYLKAIDLSSNKNLMLNQRKYLKDIYLEMGENDKANEQSALILQIENQSQNQSVEEKQVVNSQPTVISANDNKPQNEFIEPNQELFWWIGTPSKTKSIRLKPDANAKIFDAWKILDGYGNPYITIAVSDNGIDLFNPYIHTKVTRQWDFRDNEGTININYNYTQGTPIASLAIAPTLGAAPVARFMPLSGVGYSLEFMETFFNYCIVKEADIIICNWIKTDERFKLSNEQNNVISQTAQKGRDGKGCLIILPVGDDGDEEINQYAQHPDVIAVASSTSEDLHANYSNTGNNITICAPSSGGELPILALRASWDEGIPGETGANRWYYEDGIDRGPNFRHIGGTSVSASIVGGICGLILSANPNLTAKEVKQILIATADTIGSPSDYDTKGYSKKYGYGRVNAAKAVTEALHRAEKSSPTPTPTPTTTSKSHPVGTGLFRYSTNARVANKGFSVQVGSFNQWASVKSTAPILEKKFKQPSFVHISSTTPTVYRILMGQFKSIDEANVFLNVLKANGMDGFIRNLSDLKGK